MLAVMIGSIFKTFFFLIAFLMKKSLFFGLILSTAFASIPFGVKADEPGTKHFRFPGGDVEAGKEAFTGLNCIQCHTVSKVELTDPKGNRRLELELAKEVRFVKSYEDLVVAITNPKHVVTEQYRAILTNAELKGSIEALMPDLTMDMSARQLMDLVAFLDSAYRGSLPEYGAK